MPLSLFSKISDHREEPYIRPSLQLIQTDDTDSIASDATAPNNPGPGRNVGRLYDTLGSRLEHFLKRTYGAGVGAEQSHAHLGLQLFQTDSTDSESIDSIASDATAPNMPGPGRNLGRLLDALGMRLENLLNRRAGRLNRGPVAVAREIHNLRRYRKAFILGLIRDGQASPTDKEISRAFWERYERSSKEFDNLPTHEDIGNLKKLCGKLLKYCR